MAHVLTSSAQPSILPSSRRNRCRIILRVPRRIPRVTLANSRILCGAWLLCRIPKSRRNSTPRNGRRRGSGRPLPAQRIRRPFLPPCQLPPQRLTTSPRSAIKLIQISATRPASCLSRPCDCYTGTSVHPHNFQNIPALAIPRVCHTLLSTF